MMRRSRKILLKAAVRLSVSMDIKHAVRVLKQGGLVIVPTDTVYGVAADPAIPSALEKLFEVKGRDRSKQVPLLAYSISDIENYGAVLNNVERRIADVFWPGPLTLVLKVGDGTEGFRIPSHDVVLELIRQCGGVLRVTSANLSGEPPAMTADDAVKCIGKGVSAVLDDGRAPGGVPSSVVQVDISDEGQHNIRLLREGAISMESLLKVLPDDAGSTIMELL